jgi:hypothetical protein
MLIQKRAVPRGSVSVLANNAAPRQPCVDRYGVAGYGFNGQCASLPSWSPAGLRVRTTVDTCAPDRESGETAGAGCDCLRPSGLVSAGRTRVCLDASDRRTNDPGPNELFHGIRCMLFPLSSSLWYWFRLMSDPHERFCWTTLLCRVMLLRRGLSMSLGGEYDIDLHTMSLL